MGSRKAPIGISQSISGECVVFLNTLLIHRERSTRCRTQSPLSQDGELATVSFGITVYTKVFRKTSIRSVIERYL